MANIKILAPIILKWESTEFTDDPNDAGGATCYGVTFNEFKKFNFDNDHDGKITVNDLKLITEDQYEHILKVDYWDEFKGDLIHNQSVCNICVDFLYNAGTYAKILAQKILNLEQDGDIGPISIAAINNANQKDFFNKYKQGRIDYYINLVKEKPSDQKYLHGWLNRANSFTFSA